MSAASTFPVIRSSGIPIEPDALGWLEDSSHLISDGAALRARIADSGYLYLRGVLDNDSVLTARASVCRRLAEDGFLDPNAPEINAIWNRAERLTFKAEYANGNPDVERLLYGNQMLGLFATLMGGPVAHFDFTWLRAMAPGHGLPPHCDVVYMGRGETNRLFTCWTPLGRIGFDTGGLMILEGSHKHQHLRETYGRHDVDSHCSNKLDGDGAPTGDGWGDNFEWIPGIKGYSGTLGKDCNLIRNHLAAPRWLTTEYSPGDVLIFTVFTVHASMDNPSPDRIRLSTDSRYQPAGTVRDDRWIGPQPIAHSVAGKRGRVC